MKHIFTLTITVLLALLISLSACHPDNPESTTGSSELSEYRSEQESVTTKTTPHTEENTMSSELVPVTLPQNETKTQQSNEEETTEKNEPTTSISSGTVYHGTTSKGFTVTEIDGITYIDGIMIANKTYSLPSDYNPGELTADCQTAFNQMQSAAARDGCTLYISSAFRSYSHQKGLYQKYCARDGQEAADRYSARPGHSEHQTGYAIDLNTITYSFADTAEGKWVAENCWKYGFILRYPQDKESETGYRYEPWHIRFVGEQLAKDIFESGLCLEEYFGITSQYS